jgi:hypothetical protein
MFLCFMISVCGVNESPIAGGAVVGKSRSDTLLQLLLLLLRPAGARRRGCVASDENHGEKQRA